MAQDWSQDDANNMNNNNQDWSSLFSAPLNPDVFAALTANGVIGNIPPAPSSLPYQYPRPPLNVNTQPTSTASSWSQASSASPYTPYSSVPSFKPPLPRTQSSGSVSKGKSPSADDQQRSRASHTIRGHPHNAHHRMNPPVPSAPFDALLQEGLVSNSPINYNPTYSFQGDRPNMALPPSLWMSPASPNPATTPSAYPPLNSYASNIHHRSHRASFTQSPISPTSPNTDQKSSLLSDIFTDDFFAAPPSLSDHATSPFTSPRISGSPDLQSSIANDADPEQMAKEDPLAAQVWKLYARTKATLPHAQRMENLTWRMMHLTMKKKKEEEEAAARLANERAVVDSNNNNNAPDTSTSRRQPSDDAPDPDERGRRIDKGKARVRVVGFDGTNQDDHEDDE
ncbi:hypothetical protein HGRIS_002737 [Hohenbuehelia grisea]|uniref:Nitrogen regulatory protein areA GATA-like domain-containing protein n=1 Tax=Hohenbuehelia grisea TaxID=104357 RepID=A0ABR3JLB8_9AGAR